MVVLDLWLVLPVTVRYIVLAFVGLALGGLVNWAVVHLSFFGSRISPWAAHLPTGSHRSGLDRLPIWGWIRLHHDGLLPGFGQWVRPIFVECAAAAGLPLLYWWECIEEGLLPAGVRIQWSTPVEQLVHGQFVAHSVLAMLLLAATLIDLDEKTIPDTITVPGTLFGLWWAVLCPHSLPPQVFVSEGVVVGEPLWAYGGPWSAAWTGTGALLIGWAILLAWGWSLLDKTCTLRRGVWRGAVYMVVSAVRRGSWRLVGPIVIGAGSALSLAWFWQGAPWQAAFSAVLGLGFGGGVIWAVRIIGRWALRMEAMGFGDVTLMAMIGTFIGWQASLVVFFIAPLAGLVIAAVQYLTSRVHVIAFGPYLSLATVVVLVGWDVVWRQKSSAYFQFPTLVLGMLGVGLVLLGVFLWIWRVVRDRVFGLEANGSD